MSVERKKRACSKCGDIRYIVSKGLCSYCKGAENLKEKKLRESKRIDEGGTKPTKRIRSSTKAPPRKKPSSNKKKKRGLKSNSVSVLKRSLWSIFSKYIRLRDSDDNGYCKCITCDKTAYWKELQCGHFMSRRYSNTFVDEKNCGTQCPYCNLHLSGNQYVYSLALDEKYGDGTSEELLRLSKVEKRFTVEELLEKIEYYKKEVNNLLQSKNTTD